MSNYRPPLAFWKARSTWLVLITAIATLLNAFGVNVPEEFDPEGFADLVLALIPVVSGVWAWYERRDPGYRLVVNEKNG